MMVPQEEEEKPMKHLRSNNKTGPTIHSKKVVEKKDWFSCEVRL